MSVKVMSWVWEHSQSKGTDRLVLLAVADCAADNGGNAYPSMAALVRKTGLSTRTVQQAIRRLAELGELVVALNAGPGGSNRYRIRMTPAESAPPQNLHPANPAPPHDVHPPASDAPPPPHDVHHPPAPRAPGTVLEPSLEPSEISPSAAPPKSTAKTRRVTDDDPDFAAFWKTYPRRTDKGHARTAWASALKTNAAAEIIAGAELFAAQCARNRTEQRYIPHPSTWLRGERWADQPAAASNGRAPHQPYRNPEDMSVYEQGL